MHACPRHAQQTSCLHASQVTVTDNLNIVKHGHQHYMMLANKKNNIIDHSTNVPLQVLPCSKYMSGRLHVKCQELQCHGGCWVCLPSASTCLDFFFNARRIRILYTLEARASYFLSASIMALSWRARSLLRCIFDAANCSRTNSGCIPTD